MRSLRYLNFMLTVLAVLLALHLWTAWAASPTLIDSARAQGIPDAGAQRQQIIDELKLLNKKAEETKDLLTSGKVVVQVKDKPE